MTEFMKVLLSLSCSGTLLFLLLCLLKQGYRHKLSKTWQYYIWLAVALRFLVPFTFDAAVTNHLFHTLETVTTNILDETGDKTWSGTLPAAAATHMPSAKTFMGGSDEAPAVASPEPIHGVPVFFPSFLFYAWSAGALIMVSRKVTIYQSFLRYLHAGNREISDINTLNLLSDCEEALHIRKLVGLYQNPMIASPIMTGFLRPCIIIPSDHMKGKDLSYIFTHELIHYKRRDMFFKWFIQFVICIHWFNPFAYLLGNEVNHACELSCDEAVIGSLDEREKKTYGDVLLSALKAENSYKNPIASVTLSEGAEQIKERLGAIMNYKKKSKAVTAVTGLLTAAVLACFAVFGAYAGSDSSFTYTQGGYYQNGYVIELGWNISARPDLPYSATAEVTLADNSRMTVYFSEDAKAYENQPDAVAAIGELLQSLSTTKTRPALEKPFIISITPVPVSEVPTQAQAYYDSGDLIRFSAIYPSLDSAAQKAYCQKIYEEGKVAFFSTIVEDLDDSQILYYADRSEKDGKINFFSILLDYLKPEEISRYAKKYYETDQLTSFTLLLPYMTPEEQQDWLAKALSDQKNTFYMVISEELSD